MAVGQVPPSYPAFRLEPQLPDAQSEQSSLKQGWSAFSGSKVSGQPLQLSTQGAAPLPLSRGIPMASLLMAPGQVSGSL